MEHSTAVICICLLFGLLDSGNSQQNVLSPEEMLQNTFGIANVPEINVNTSALPNIEEATNLFEQKCTKNGGPNAFENAKNAKTEMEQCLKSLIDMNELNAEMESAKPKGELDEVFKKYCRRSPIFMNCVNNFTTAIEPCLEQKERDNKKVVMNITESLLSFVCYKEGDRIALFISAGGPECFQSKRQEIEDCINATFGSSIFTPDSISGGMPGVDKIPSLIVGNKECTDMDNLQRCVVRELEKCSDPTPGNIVESIFRYIKKVTPCESLLMNSRTAAVVGEQNSSTVITPISIMIVISVLLQLKHYIVFI